MSYHPQGINPISDGNAISALWGEDIEDRLDALEAAGTGTMVSASTYIARKNGAVYEAWNDGSLTFGGAGNMGSIDGTDPSAVIQACIDALTDGGFIHLRPATYTLPTTLTMDTHITLEGEGPDATILSCVNTFHDGLITASNESHGVIRDLSLYGNSAGATATGISLGNCDTFLLDNLYVNDMNYGGAATGAIHLSGTTKSRIRSCRIHDNPGTKGIVLVTSSDRNMISNCIISDSGQSGILVHTSGYNAIGNCHITGSAEKQVSFWTATRNTISNCTVENGTQSGIAFNEACYGNVVNGNTVVNNSHHGIEFAGKPTYAASYQTSITGNTITNNSQHGICIDNGYDISITGNVIADNSVAAAGTYSGILMQDGGEAPFVSKVTILGNRIYGGNQKYGIESLESTDYITAIGNILLNNQTAIGLSLVGSHNTVWFNPGYIDNNSGIASVASGDTTVVVNHGCNFTPDVADITILPYNGPTADPGHIWVDTITATQFTIHTTNDPGVSGANFSWKVHRKMVD